MRSDEAGEGLDLNAVMEHGRKIRRAPDVVRARLMARARAVTAAGEAAAGAPAMLLAPQVRPGVRVAVAAIVLLAFGAGAAAALHVRDVPPGDVAPAPVRSPEKHVSMTATSAAPAEEPPPARAFSARRSHARRLSSPQESYAAEVALLQRAQAEYAARAFSNALVLVKEHAHRFPNGRLAEEREALRVRSLAGSNRGDEARRALLSFEIRFPRSVLLPRLQEAARTAEDE